MAILVYGSMVPDIVFTVPRLPQRGEDVPARSVNVVAAGGGGNVAVALAGWGYDVIAGGNSVGDDPLGRWVATEFAARGISTPQQFVAPEGVTAANGIIVTPDGERTIIGSDYSTGHLASRRDMGRRRGGHGRRVQRIGRGRRDRSSS